jgi:hypothetical protein
MNNEQVKQLLLKVADCETDFTMILSGKASSQVNGLYKPHSREIILHNLNFETEDQLVYTAIHEYAHHLHCERKGFTVSGKAHTNEFWGIFHDLLVAAEGKGLYRNVFESEPAFVELTSKIKRSCMAENGRLMLEFGRLMVEAQTLCERHKARFEDYLDRALGVPRTTASAAVRAAAWEIDPEIGWDGMRIAAGIKDPETRAEAVEALKTGSSPAAVRARFSPSREPEDTAERLFKEKARLEKTLHLVQERLEEVERRLSEAGLSG